MKSHRELRGEGGLQVPSLPRWAIQISHCPLAVASTADAARAAQVPSAHSTGSHFSVPVASVSDTQGGRLVGRLRPWPLQQGFGL